MNLVQLEYFEAVYERRSYAAAAKAIPMSHQGLLKSMAALTAELGVPLFTVSEGSTAVTPTPYADAFHAFVADVRAARAMLDAEVARITRAGNTIRLCSATGVTGLLGMGFLEAFRRAHPEVTVVGEELPDLRCDESLAAGSADLALTVPPFDERFETVPLYQMDRYVWVPRADRLARADVVRACDLAGRHVGVMGPAFKNYAGLLDLMAREGVEPASVDAASEMLWLSQYAHASGHVAFTDRHVARLFESDEQVVARRFEGLPWGFGVSWLRGRELTAQERALADHCVAHARRLTERGAEGFLA